MTSPPPNLTRFSQYLLAMLVVVGAFLVSFVLYTRAENQLQQANELRLRSILLAEELRQSSNDLTRLVRSYVATSNPVFKQQFLDVVAIRDGKKPRPLDYGPSYWDFRLEEREGSPVASGPAIPLLELMRAAGFTQEELAKLNESKAKSDALVEIEFKAIALIEADRPTHPRKREQAASLLLNDEFHRGKVEVMRPLIEFERMVQQRTLDAVRNAEAKARTMHLTLIGLGGLLMLLLWRFSREHTRILGCSVPVLHQTIARLGRGDFSTPIEVLPGRESSVLGWLAETQQRLAKLELRQYKAIVDSTDDAIISMTMDGIIRSWNQGAEKIYGYRAEEVIGQSMDLLIPEDRANEESELIARIAQGERVDHFETVRRCKNGALINISATISPIMDEKGVVIGASKIARDITRSKEAELEIHRLAYYDPLTQLANRRLFIDRLEHALSAAQRSQQFFAILFIDLDNFKTLNDTRGHDVGDLLLKQVAQRLESCIRTSDTVSRFGGDEFVVMLENLGARGDEAADRVERLGEKILRALNAPYQLAGYKHHCSPSIGVTLSNGQATTSEMLLKQADLAMYQSKAAGRNTLRFFDPEMQETVNRHAQLDRDLREAVASDQLMLYYQVQVDAQGQATGAEALVRWNHPERGLVPPDEFIPRAEETGQILKLGQWVLEAACRQLARWARSPQTQHLSLAVNVSIHQLRQTDFVTQVLETLKRTDAPTHRLKLELTETLLASHIETIIAKMDALQAHGVRFSLDDFGTGYSSLSYLKRLPLDQLKIDRSFVKDILTDPNDEAIARMVVVLAESMDIEVIAEGVETQAQRDRLQALGCHAYQGELFGKPLPVKDFEALLARNQDQAQKQGRAQAAPTRS